MLVRKRALDRLAKEKVLYERRRGGDVRVCLVYPNRYPLAMANLGFQAVFHIFESDPRVSAERCFLPDADELEAVRAEGLKSFESGCPLADFDIVAFSIAFETDYLNLLAILNLARIPARRAARAGRSYPLIVAGGSAVFLNPEPVADFVDLFLIGEGEEMVPEFLARYRRGEPRIDDLATVEGAYLPDYFTPVYRDGRIAEIRYAGPGRPRVSRRLIRDLNRFNTSSLILAPESVFGDMYLVEASRGCQWGCRFCAAGFMYRPIRYRDPARLTAEAERGLAERKVVGLVGAEMASVPGVAEVAAAVADRGGRLSPSSLKADCISPKLAAALARGGNHSVTIAPEAGSERMRQVINKNLSENQILDAAEMMVGRGVERLKLYFMLGLPEETAEDVSGIAALTGKVLERARRSGRRIGQVTVSLNPFVPKPWTPFQWDPMEDGRSIKHKIASLRAELGRMGGGIELDAESPREAYFQTLVSRGDRRVGAILERLSARRCGTPGEIQRELGAIRNEARAGTGNLPDPDFFVTRRYDSRESLPWDFIDHHIEKWFLLSERKKAHFAHQTKPCDVTRCKVCGAC